VVEQLFFPSGTEPPNNMRQQDEGGTMGCLFLTPRECRYKLSSHWFGAYLKLCGVAWASFYYKRGGVSQPDNTPSNTKGRVLPCLQGVQFSKVIQEFMKAFVQFVDVGGTIVVVKVGGEAVYVVGETDTQLLEGGRSDVLVLLFALLEGFKCAVGEGE